MTIKPPAFPRSTTPNVRADHRVDFEELADHAHQLRAQYMRWMVRRALHVIRRRIARELDETPRRFRRAASLLNTLARPILYRR